MYLFSRLAAPSAIHLALASTRVRGRFNLASRFDDFSSTRNMTFRIPGSGARRARWPVRWRLGGVACSTRCG